MLGDYIFNNFSLNRVEHEDKEEDPNLVMVHSPAEEPPLLPHVPQSSQQEPTWTVRRRSSADVR